MQIAPESSPESSVRSLSRELFVVPFSSLNHAAVGVPLSGVADVLQIMLIISQSETQAKIFARHIGETCGRIW